LKRIFPERVALLISATRSDKMFKREVLPAPDEPIMYVVRPGGAYPEQSLTII